MSLEEIYLEIHPEDIAYVKFIFESYEGVGIIRTVDAKKAVIVVMVMGDFLTTARSILTSLKEEISLTETARPDDIGEDWLLNDLATESPTE